MTLTELIDFAKARGFYPINITGEADPESENVFVGSLEEYFAAVAFLGAKAIFIQNSTLAQIDFIHEIQIFSDDEDGEEEPKKLTLV